MFALLNVSLWLYDLITLFTKKLLFRRDITYMYIVYLTCYDYFFAEKRDLDQKRTW